MKKILAALLLSAMCTNAFAQAINVQKALSEGLIKATFVSTGTHTNESMVATIQNLTGKAITIELPTGLQFENSDTFHQNLLLLQPALVSLLPKRSATDTLKAVCYTMSKGCPMETTNTFKIVGMCNANVLGIANLCNTYKHYDYSAQRAIWAAYGSASLNEVNGSDSVQIMSLRNALAKFIPEKVQPFDNSYRQRAQITVSRELFFHTMGTDYVRQLNGNETIVYGIYDENDSLVVAGGKVTVPPAPYNGRQQVRWDINADHLNPSKKYFLRFKVNGVTRVEFMYDYWT
ncbi:MAG: hypothetical protein RL660_2808 [Bacteroidota bacterium]|jgi:hypothetical protein